MKLPNTSIACAACKGSRLGRFGQQCGACFGFGLSTAPWDQRRSGTTITVWDDEEKPCPKGAEVIPGAVVCRIKGMGRIQGRIFLVSWPNPDYAGV